MNVAIVIPTHNRIRELSIILNQIKAQICRLTVFHITIIVVVDGSSDGTIEMMMVNHPDCMLVIGDGTWWYTKSMNAGFRKAINLNVQYILTLNDDIELDDNYLNTLLNCISKLPNSSICGSICYTREPPTRVTTSGVFKINRYTGRFYSYHKFLEVVELANLIGLHKSLVLPGRGMLIPAEVLVKLNYFDDKFPQYHSDGDFTLRAIAAGYPVYISWDAIIYSHHSQTSYSSSFKKMTIKKLLASFTDPHSRNHWMQNIRFIFRHYNKICAPFIFLFWIGLRIRNYVKNN